MNKSTPTLDENGNLCLAPRVIAPPQSIGAQARKFLATPSVLPATEEPPAHDKEAWRERIARTDAALEPMAEQMRKAAPATVETQLSPASRSTLVGPMRCPSAITASGG